MWRLGILATAIAGLCTAFAALAETDENEREGGILGTGIVGTITALGSIYVNGQHILFDDDLGVEHLLPGHTVAVLAQPEGARWRASDVRQILPLVGPAQISTDGQLAVMGTPVLLAEDLRADIATGDWIAVSGLWQAGRVIATRIDPVNGGTSARIEGTLFEVGEDRPLLLGGTAITGLQPQHLQDGDVIRVTGKPVGNSLLVSQLETGVFADAPGTILIEGYFSAPKASGLYTVLGSNIVSYTDTPEMIDPNARQFFCGRVGEMMPVAAVQADDTRTFPIPGGCFAGTEAKAD